MYYIQIIRNSRQLKIINLIRVWSCNFPFKMRHCIAYIILLFSGANALQIKLSVINSFLPLITVFLDHLYPLHGTTYLVGIYRRQTREYILPGTIWWRFGRQTGWTLFRYKSWCQRWYSSRRPENKDKLVDLSNYKITSIYFSISTYYI